MNRYPYAISSFCITQNSEWPENNNLTVIIRAIDPSEPPGFNLRYCIERLDGGSRIADNLQETAEYSTNA